MSAPIRCFAPMNESAWYLGVLRSTCDGVTLRLHAYIVDGEDVVSYSAVGPRETLEETEALLPKAEQRVPGSTAGSEITVPFEGVCCVCSLSIPAKSKAVHVTGRGLHHPGCAPA